MFVCIAETQTQRLKWLTFSATNLLLPQLLAARWLTLRARASRASIIYSFPLLPPTTLKTAETHVNAAKHTAVGFGLTLSLYLSFCRCISLSFCLATLSPILPTSSNSVVHRCTVSPAVTSSSRRSVGQRRITSAFIAEVV